MCYEKLSSVSIQSAEVWGVFRDFYPNLTEAWSRSSWICAPRPFPVAQTRALYPRPAPYRKRGLSVRKPRQTRHRSLDQVRSRFRAFRSHLDTQPAPHGILRHSPFPGVSLFGRKRSFLDAFSAVISREPQSTHQRIKCIINQSKASYGQEKCPYSDSGLSWFWDMERVCVMHGANTMEKVNTIEASEDKPTRAYPSVCLWSCSLHGPNLHIIRPLNWMLFTTT